MREREGVKREIERGGQRKRLEESERADGKREGGRKGERERERARRERVGEQFHKNSL